MIYLQHQFTLENQESADRHRAENINHITLVFKQYEKLSGLYGDAQRGMVTREFTTRYPVYDEQRVMYTYPYVHVYRIPHTSGKEVNLQKISGLSNDVLAAWFAVEGKEYGYALSDGQLCSREAWVPCHSGMYIAVYSISATILDISMESRLSEGKFCDVPAHFIRLDEENIVVVDEHENVMAYPVKTKSIYQKGSSPEELIGSETALEN